MRRFIALTATALGPKLWIGSVVLCVVLCRPCHARHLPEPCLGTAHGMNVPYGQRPLEDVMSSCLRAPFVCADTTRVWRWLGLLFCSGGHGSENLCHCTPAGGDAAPNLPRAEHPAGHTHIYNKTK